MMANNRLLSDEDEEFDEMEEDFDSFLPPTKSLFPDEKGQFETFKNPEECLQHALKNHGFDLKVYSDCGNSE